MLLRQTLLFLPAQVLVPLSQIAAGFLWTYWLGHEAMGTYALIWSAQELISVALLTWWTVYCLRYASDLAHEGKAARLDETEMGVQLICAVLQAAAAILAVWLLIPSGLTFGMVAATLSFTLTRNIAGHLSTRARAQLETVPYTINLCAGSILGLAFGLFAVTNVDATPEALLYAYAAAQFLGIVLSWPFSSVRLRRPRIDPEIGRAAWRFGSPLLVSASGSWVGNHAIRFVVEIGQGRTGVGMITVGWWMGLRLAAFLGLLLVVASFNVAVNRMRAEGRAAAIEQLARNSAMLLAILAPSVAGVWLIGGQLVGHLVDASYREMTAAILPVGVTAGAIRVFREHGADPIYLMFASTRMLALISLLDAAVTILFCWIGLQHGGLVGAAWGACLGALAGAVASMSIAMSRLGYRVEIADVTRVALATALMTAPLMFVPGDMPLWGVLLTAASGAAIYAVALAAMYPSQASQAVQLARSNIGRIIAR